MKVYMQPYQANYQPEQYNPYASMPVQFRGGRRRRHFDSPEDLAPLLLLPFLFDRSYHSPYYYPPYPQPYYPPYYSPYPYNPYTPYPPYYGYHPVTAENDSTQSTGLV